MLERAAATDSQRAIDGDPSPREIPVALPWLAVGVLAWREIIRFLRQPSRIAGAVGTPVLFWVLLGAGFQGVFRVGEAAAGGGSFSEFYFPGTLVLIVLFTSIFSAISVIDDRREGFLQGVLVSPTPRWAMVLGKVLGGAALAVGQGLLFLALGLTMGIGPTAAGWPALLGQLALVAVGLTSLGLALAWQCESTQGFHAIMNLVLFPLWMLSGAFFPIPAPQAEASWSQWLLHGAMRINPLSYAVAGIRQLLSGPGEAAANGWTPDTTLGWGVLIFFTAISFAAALASVSWRQGGETA